MKCPYCAEEIQPDAAVCRHCSRPVPRGVEALDRMSPRYVLGRMTGDQYAVWEYASGEPVARFPRTREGWDQAWGVFSAGTPEPAGGQGTSNGMAVTGMVLGIVGAAVGLIPLLSILALICGLLAAIFGGLGLARAREVGSGRAMAITGLILGFVAMGLAILGFVTIDRAIEEIDRIFESPL